MSFVDATMLEQKMIDFNIFSYAKKLMYWQGFWIEDPESDLEFYLQFFSPWFAGLLIKHRYMRLALRFIRRIIPTFVIFTTSTQVFFLFPMAIYLYKTASMDVMANFLGIVLESIQLTAIITVYCQQDTFRDIFEEIDDILVEEKLDNPEQKGLFHEARRFCGNILKRVLPLVVTLITVPMCYNFIFVLMPERKFPIREWYPWETTSTPNFEITLFIRLVQSVIATFLTMTLVAILPLGMTLPVSCFKILNNKFENIRTISINRIKARKLKKSVSSTDKNTVAIDIEHSQQVPTPAHVFQGQQVRTVRDVLNSRRVDNLALLRPLYETSTHVSGAPSDGIPLKRVIQGHTLKDKQNTLKERRVDSLALLRPLYKSASPVPGVLRDEIPLTEVLLGQNLRTGRASLTSRRADSLVLLNPLYEVASPLTGTVRGEVLLTGVLQGHQVRARQSNFCARRVGNLSLLSHLYEPESSLPRDVKDEMPLQSTFQADNLKRVRITRNAWEIDDLQLLKPLYQPDLLVTATLSDVLRPQGTNSLLGVTVEELDKEMEVVLGENVHLHVRLIRFMDSCASFLNVFFVVMVVVNILAMAVSSVLLVKSDVDEDALLYGLFVVVFTVLVTSIYLVVNNAMQNISDQHAAVCKSIYSCDWLEASPRFKKSMLVVMSRANVPLVVKPTGLDPLSRKNFAHVMNSAYKMINTLNTFVK